MPIDCTDPGGLAVVESCAKSAGVADVTEPLSLFNSGATPNLHLVGEGLMHVGSREVNTQARIREMRYVSSADDPPTTEQRHHEPTRVAR